MKMNEQEERLHEFLEELEKLSERLGLWIVLNDEVLDIVNSNGSSVAMDLRVDGTKYLID